MEAQKYHNPGAAPEREIRVITLKDAVEELRKLADRVPHRVAVGILAEPFGYIPSGAQHAVCIVGHAYAEWGIPVADLACWENRVGAERWLPGTGPDGEGGPVDFLDYGIRFTVAAAAFLHEAQKLQDGGITWGTVFHTLLGRAHVVFGTELIDEGTLYEHGENISWPEPGYVIRRNF